MPFPSPEDDLLASFELPDDLMSVTFEHAISDDADSTHERGHGVAAALQRKLKGSTVEYAFPGVVTATLPSGAVARCGGPVTGWRVEIGSDVVNVEIPDDETTAAALAKILRRY